jgi:hypothetical protein
MRVYLSCPYQGKPENLERALRWMRWLADHRPGDTIVASWILWAQLGLYAGKEDEAMAACMAEIRTCDVFALAGIPHGSPLTSGTTTELAYATAWQIDCTFFRAAEPPSDNT